MVHGCSCAIGRVNRDQSRNKIRLSHGEPLMMNLREMNSELGFFGVVSYTDLVLNRNPSTGRYKRPINSRPMAAKQRANWGNGTRSLTRKEEISPSQPVRRRDDGLLSFKAGEMMRTNPYVRKTEERDLSEG